MKCKQEHINNKYFAKITTVSNYRALILELPKNIFVNVPEVKIVYELESNKLNIYKNGSKSESIDCPEYALRFLVATDITILLAKYRIHSSLIHAIDAEGNVIKGDEIRIGLVDLIIPSKNSETRRLEFIFNNSLTAYAASDGKGDIPLEIVDGLEIITKRYLRGNKNE